MGITAVLIPPCPLADYHQLDSFSCGVSSLDSWLKDRARRNEDARASRTYVLCDAERVIGYYALAAGSLAAGHAPSKIKRNMPDPIPAMIVGRLAVDRNYQGKGLGDALLRDAVFRILQAAKIAGIKVILVHAISDKARSYYLERDFISSPFGPMTLMLPLESIK